MCIYIYIHIYIHVYIHTCICTPGGAGRAAARSRSRFPTNFCKRVYSLCTNAQTVVCGNRLSIYFAQPSIYDNHQGKPLV